MFQHEINGMGIVQAELITLIMLGFLALRIWRGYTSPRRNGEARILQLWADFTAVTGLLALTAAWAPGAFA